jgi:hypothetical protein
LRSTASTYAAILCGCGFPTGWPLWVSWYMARLRNTLRGPAESAQLPGAALR